MPHKTTQANIRHEQFWEDIFTVGIWAQQVWTWQWTRTPRICENSSHPQWDTRTTATTLAAASRTITNLQYRANNNNGILQSNNSIQQVETTNVINCEHKPRWRNSTHGHLGNEKQRKRIQRKSKYKGKSKGKGKSYGGYKGKGKGYKGYGKGPVGQGNPFGQKGQYPQQMNKGKGKGNKGKQAQDVCYRCGQNIVESHSTITEKHQQWQQSNMTTHNNGMKIHMVMITIGGTTWDIKDKTCNINHNNLHGQHQMPQLQQTIHQQSRLLLEYSTSPWANHGCTCTRRQCRTNNRFNRHYGRQWSSYTCLPTMVCTRVSNTTTISRQRTTTTHSDQQWDQTLRIQVGLHAHCGRATNCHTILCVWRTSTHCISCKTWGTRIYPYDYTSKRLQHNTHQATKPLLPSSNSCTNSTKLYIADPTDKWGNNSNDCTYSAHTTRSRTNSRRKQWLLDVQQWRYLVRVHRTKRKALFLPYKTCPVPTDRLENYRRTIVNRPDKNNEDFEEQFRNLSQHQQKLVLQGQAWTGGTWFKLKAGTTVPTKTTTAAPQKLEDKTSSKQDTSTRLATFTPTQHIILQQRHQQAHSWCQQANQQQQHYQHHLHLTWQNTWLVGTRRTHVEESPHTTTQWTIHTTTNTAWTRHCKAQAWQGFVHESTRWNKNGNVWRAMDITTTTSNRQDIDRVYKLWGRNNIQGRIHHRWRRYTTSSFASKGHQSTTTTHWTRAQRTQLDTPTISIMVFNLRGKQRQSKQSSTTKDKQAASRTMWLCIHQHTCQKTSHTSAYSNWCRDRY